MNFRVNFGAFVAHESQAAPRMNRTASFLVVGVKQHKAAFT
jgi:hypothetical protein